MIELFYSMEGKKVNNNDEIKHKEKENGSSSHVRSFSCCDGSSNGIERCTEFYVNEKIRGV